MSSAPLEPTATETVAAGDEHRPPSLLSDSLVFVSVPASFADLPSDVILCFLDFLPSEADRQSLRHVDSRCYELVPPPYYVDNAGNVIKPKPPPKKTGGVFTTPKKENKELKANTAGLAWLLGAEQVDFLGRYYDDLPEEDGAHEDRNTEKHIGVQYFIGSGVLPTAGDSKAPEHEGWVKVVAEKGKKGRMVCRWCRLVVPCEVVPGRDGKPSAKKKCKACGAVRWW